MELMTEKDRKTIVEFTYSVLKSRKIFLRLSLITILKPHVKLHLIVKILQ